VALSFGTSVIWQSFSCLGLLLASVFSLQYDRRKKLPRKKSGSTEKVLRTDEY